MAAAPALAALGLPCAGAPAVPGWPLWYHKDLSRAAAEELLAWAWRAGSFLVRDSESVAGAFALCVLGTAMVSLPKFSISATYSLKEPLSQLGITEIFTDHADLSRVTGQPLKLSEVTHKAVLTVDESGTEAAGATAAEAIPISVPPAITFNRPFVFLVFNDVTNTAIFVGKMKNPMQP